MDHGSGHLSRESALRYAIAGSLAMAATMGVGRFVYTPILPLMIGADALNAATGGFVAGANFLGYLVGALAASLQAFSRNGRGWIYAGLFAGVLLTAGMALEFGVVWMAGLRFFSGVASAFAMIFVTSLVMHAIAERRRPGLSSLHFAGIGAAIAVSAAMVSLLAHSGFGWQAIWLGAAGLGLVAVIASLLLLPAGSAAIRPESRRSDDDSIPAQVWIFIVGYGFFGFGYVILATFINAMAKADPALFAVEPYVWIVVGLSSIPSLWFWGMLARRLGNVAVYGAACLVEAFGVTLTVMIPTPATILTGAMLLGGTFVALTAIGLAHARVLAPQNPSRVIALMTASFGLGQMIGPMVAGVLFQRNGNLVAASVLAALALVLAAFLAGVSSIAAEQR